MPAQKFKFGKCKKTKIDEVPHLVLKLTGKVPAKIIRELKLKINEAVVSVTTPIVHPE